MEQREEFSRVAPPKDGNGINNVFQVATHTHFKGGVHVGAAEDHGRELGQASTIEKYRDEECNLFLMRFSRRLNKGDLRMPVHRMELGRIRFPDDCWLFETIFVCFSNFYFVLQSWFKSIFFKRGDLFILVYCLLEDNDSN